LQGLALLDPSVPFQASVLAAKPWLAARSVAAEILTAGHLVFAVHAFMLVRRKRGAEIDQPAFFFIRPVLVKK
ncbi:hypothetical protein KQ880_15230, partial [Listeria monocytogenes]|nr:hypothetical protein [Listeria monocytogenes]